MTFSTTSAQVTRTTNVKILAKTNNALPYLHYLLVSSQTPKLLVELLVIFCFVDRLYKYGQALWSEYCTI